MTNRIDYILAIQANTEALKAVQAELTTLGTGAVSAAQAIRTALGAIGDEATQTGAKVKKGADDSTQALQGVKRTALEIAGGLGLATGVGAITAGIVHLGEASLKTAGDLEQQKIAFTGLLGSASAADGFIKQMQDLAAHSPFETDQLLRYSERLLGVGFSAQQVKPLMVDVGNAVAAMGGGAEQIDRVTLAMAQMQTRGKAMGGDMLQLTEAQIPAWQILADRMGLSVAQVQKLSEEGRISAGVFQEAFAAWAQSDKIAGAMDRQSQSFQGLLSTVHDLGTQLEQTFGTPVIQAVEPVIQSIITDLQNPATVANIHAMGVEVGAFAANVLKAGEEVGKLLGLVDHVSTPAEVASAAAVSSAQAALDTAMRTSAVQKDQLTTATDYSAQLRDNSRAIEDTRKAWEATIAPLREKLQLENDSYQTAVNARNLARAETKLGTDQQLAGDIFSSAGAAARDRLPADQERIADLQFQQAHEQRVQGLNAQIRGQEKLRDAALDALDKQKRAIQDAEIAAKSATTATNTQAGAMLTLSKYILDQITHVENLALAWGKVSDAQEGERESGRAAAVAAGIIAAGAAGGGTQPNDLAHGAAASILGMLSGNPATEKAGHAEMRNAIGTAAGNTVGAVFADPTNADAVQAYQKWLAGAALTPAEQAALERTHPMGYTGATTAGTGNAPFATAGATVGGKPPVTVNIYTGPASQADWNAVAGQIDRSLAHHWNGEH